MDVEHCANDHDDNRTHGPVKEDALAPEENPTVGIADHYEPALKNGTTSTNDIVENPLSLV